MNVAQHEYSGHTRKLVDDVVEISIDDYAESLELIKIS